MTKMHTLETSGVEASDTATMVPASNFAATVHVVVTGSATYTVQVSNETAGSITDWQDHDTLAAQTTSQIHNIVVPVANIRVNQTAGAGSTKTYIVQNTK